MHCARARVSVFVVPLLALDARDVAVENVCYQWHIRRVGNFEEIGPAKVPFQMPGIEAFGRNKPKSDSAEKISITPEALAHLLFSRVVEDTTAVLDNHIERFKSYASFQPHRFERSKFVYLVADIAIALTNAASRQPALAKVIPDFRHRVVLIMKELWGDSEDDIDAEIEKASANYARLLFTNPETARGLSFDWAQEWLRAVGVDETNPVVLFSVSQTWKRFHTHTVKFLSAMRVLDAGIVATKIFALSAAKYWDNQIDPSERLDILNQTYWRLKGRRCRRIRTIHDYRDIARHLQPLISEFFDPKVVLDWFHMKPDTGDTERMEQWQFEALEIVMRFDPFPGNEFTDS